MTRHQWDSEQAADAARKATVVRQERWARQRLASEVAYRVVTELDDVAPAALNAALTAIRRAEEGMESVPVETTLDVQRLANTAEIVHRISRLASGQSTSNVAHAGTEDRDARIARLRQQLTQLDSDATPTPDAPTE